MASSVAIQDVNGDGKPDLVVSVGCPQFDPTGCAGLLVNSAEVLLGNGDGTFQTAQAFGSFGYGWSLIAGLNLAIADVDGDGRPDLILTSACTDSLCSTTGKIEDGIVVVLINTSTFPDSAASTTTLVSSSNPSGEGQSVTFTATVSSSGAGTFAGTVSLLDGSTSLGLFPVSSGGIATAAISTLAGGTQKITATYNGSADFTSSTSGHCILCGQLELRRAEYRQQEQPSKCDADEH